MKLSSLIVFFFIGLLALSACGGESAPCDFQFSTISNGASAQEVESYWSCQSGNEDYALAFFEDGAGVAETLGVFTWEENACGEAIASTAHGQIQADSFSGSIQSEALTFRWMNPESGEEIFNSCFLVFVNALHAAEENIPENLPEDAEPVGDQVDEEILESPDSSPVGLAIFAQDGQFLGLVNDNSFDLDSICNPYGNYGSEYSATSIWNRYGSYGGEVGILSAFNNISANPPILFEGENPIAYVTTNTLLLPQINSFYLLEFLQNKGCSITR